ncbi:MAG: aldehyde dehydrogenase family protein [Rhodothermales bacterium]
MNDPQQIFDRMRSVAAESPWPDVDTRIEWLRDLRRAILQHRGEIRNAVASDFDKSEVEADLTEIIPVLLEIRTALRNLKAWVVPKRIRTTFPLWGLTTRIQYHPKGVVLIVAPWNYPFNLSLGPLVSALAAGNRAIVKPSERVPHSSGLLSDIVRSAVPKDVVTVLQGGAEMGDRLLQLPFDHFYFTGGERVGKLVARAAATHLRTTTLELGGKSPAIVDGTLGMQECAEKIIRGKYLNAGQTCIAPDYVVVHEEHFDRFVKEALAQAARFEKATEIASPVDEAHDRRLKSLLEDALNQGAVLQPSDKEKRSLTIVTGVPLTCRLMQEEIFGPILPVLRYRGEEELMGILNRNPTPLSTYVFSRDEVFVDKLVRIFPTGSVSVNETLVHFVHPRLPFGGVGRSGFGRSHGRFGFETFSNPVPVMRQNLRRGVVPLIYPASGPLQDWMRRILYRIVGGKDPR